MAGLNPDEGEANGGSQDFSCYELCREERIKENRERMRKLGIVEISLQINSLKKASAKTKSSPCRTSQRSSPSPFSPPTRRSSRLQNVTPVSYTEIRLKKKDAAVEEDDDLVGDGFKPEVYTEGDEKLLGRAEMSWTLFVDGYGKDGKRIYDPFKGKTCHQCRQKTLGHRTHCSKCELVRGQFCGDCLYMRYGENVLEANQNSNWICPVCRGICNCSLCRQAKGWPPTGPLYRKVSSLGFKSVAHYLIQNRRKGPEKKSDASHSQTSAKRSLPFSERNSSEENGFPALSRLQETTVKQESSPFSDTRPSKENEFSDLSELQEMVKKESSDLLKPEQEYNEKGNNEFKYGKDEKNAAFKEPEYENTFLSQGVIEPVKSPTDADANFASKGMSEHMQPSLSSNSGGAKGNGVCDLVCKHSDDTVVAAQGTQNLYIESMDGISSSSPSITKRRRACPIDAGVDSIAKRLRSSSRRN